MPSSASRPTTDDPLVPHVPGGRRLGLHDEGGPVRASTAPSGGERRQFSWISPQAALGVAQRQDRPLGRRLDRRRAQALGRGAAAQGRRLEAPDHALRGRRTRSRSWCSATRARATTRSTTCCARSGRRRRTPTSPSSSATSSTPPGTCRTTTTSSTGPTASCPGRSTPIPGNHDWYDGLHGFMTLLCGADPDLRPPVHAEQEPLASARSSTSPGASRPRRCRSRSSEMQEQRPEPSGQPAPYFAIELKELLLVGLDTGIQSGIDDEQGEWLRKISKHPEGQDPPDREAARRRRRAGRRCPIAGSATP